MIKIVTYLKNKSSGINAITPYELGNFVCPNLSHVKMVGFRVWINIPKEKKVKPDVFSSQMIFIGYESKNQYRVYNPLTRKVYFTRDCFVDEQHLYYRKILTV